VLHVRARADDHRIFVGDLGNEVNDDVLTKAFVKYPSFAKAKVIRDKKVRVRRGVSLGSSSDVVVGHDASAAASQPASEWRTGFGKGSHTVHGVA
jgi:hypothetical protein